MASRQENTPSNWKMLFRIGINQGDIFPTGLVWRRLNHLEYDWETPLYRQMFSRLASSFQLLRYDARGNGLSEWDIEHISFDTWISDLHTIVNASGFQPFPLFGMSQGCVVALALFFA